MGAAFFYSPMTDQLPGIVEMFAAFPVAFVVACALLGLLVGSFLNVVIHRVPIMMDNELRAECTALAAADGAAGQTPPIPTYNIVTPRSACPRCKAPITALQNIPVVSWLALRGKCASCKTPISARYPLVELATGALSAFVAWHYGVGLQAMAALLFTWLLIALTMIDFDTQFLPDSLTYPLLWLGLIVSLWHPAWGATGIPVGPRESIIGAVAGYLSLWSVYWAFKLLTGKEGMGYGDFKLLAGLGAWMGATMLLPIIIFASGVGAIFGVVIMIRQRKGRETQIAFGPFLAIAGWIALVAGNDIVTRYLALFARHP
jgi:leader peptidase (prepilin peptidase)/N-methyltransferase